MKPKKIAAIITAVLAVLLLGLSTWLFLNGRTVPNQPPEPPAVMEPAPEPTPEPEPHIEPQSQPDPVPDEEPAQEEIEEPEEEDNLPHDKLFITVERQDYQDGELQLIIPKLNVDKPVLNGVDAATLSRGLGLYDYAQLPGEGNRNVSIAGHRNGRVNGKVTDTMPFYYVDTLGDGDYLYLRDAAHIYRYKWKEAVEVEPSDWGPIYSQGYSCLTLTTCTPIGINTQRLIIRAELDEIFDATDDFIYAVTQDPLEP